MKKNNYHLIEEYHFNGFTKVSIGLINFIDSFKRGT